jgi:hypothetical protein
MNTPTDLSVEGPNIEIKSTGPHQHLVTVDGRTIGMLQKVVVTIDAQMALPKVEMTFLAQTLQWNIQGQCIWSQNIPVYELKDGVLTSLTKSPAMETSDITPAPVKEPEAT